MKDPGCRGAGISVDASFGFTPFLNLSVVELCNTDGHSNHSEQVGTLGCVNT